MRWIVAGAFVLGGLGCEHRAHPWDQPDAGDSLLTQAPPPPIVLPHVDGVDGGERAAEPETPVPPVRVGGSWVRCYGGFHPTGEPLRDVTRLSILCGPENGMRRFSRETLEGVVAVGAPSVDETFEARLGECYRIFAVAEPTVLDLDVVVRSSRGAAIAADHGEDAWPIVQPDRPFCALEDDRYTIEVSAKRGSGRFAAEVWSLSPSQRLPKGQREHVSPSARPTVPPPLSVSTARSRSPAGDLSPAGGASVPPRELPAPAP